MDSVFGLLGDDYAIIAADASASRSILVFKHDQDKIMELDSHKLFAGAGTPADSVHFMEFVSASLKLWVILSVRVRNMISFYWSLSEPFIIPGCKFATAHDGEMNQRTHMSHF